ncbi:MAG: translation elongation factor Ts [Rickettsiales bacterium]|jgi:elongation factor Ts|nr:translation elongation factor Ts [Rickettsiales bacterium]
MTEISAQLVKQLRDRTGAGMMDAKKALVETGGDIEKAIDALRAKGLAKAAKRSERDAGAGVVGIRVGEGKGVAVEVNSETDFVARNDKFLAFAAKIADAAFEKDGDLDKILDGAMKEELANQIATIGENLAIRRADKVEAAHVISYVHNRLADGIGLIGVLVGIESGADAARVAETGEQIAMHVAASSPLFLDVADVDEATLEREKAVARDKAIAAGKPADIAEKMVAGNIKKYYDEAVLLEQAFFIDPAKKIKDVLKSISPDARITKFARFQIGK